jgi:hypothetical protein
MLLYKEFSREAGAGIRKRPYDPEAAAATATESQRKWSPKPYLE